MLKAVFYLLVFLSLYSCQKEEINESIQPLNAEELVFNNGREFQEFLEYYDLKEKSENLVEGSLFSCTPLPEANLYPAQQNDDYLHEERFDGLYHVVLFDHIVTRKMINIIIPETGNDAVDFCNINLKLKNPDTGQKVTFKNIYNWSDFEGKPLFNTNRNVYYLWGYSSGSVAFSVIQKHMPTGENLNYGHDSLSLKFEGIGIY